LARLFAIATLGAFFDGTEQFGTDYARKLTGRDGDRDPQEFEARVVCTPRALIEAPETIGTFSEQHAILGKVAQAFDAQGVRLVFYVPPTREAMQAPEHGADYRALYAALAATTRTKVLDFSDCQLPERYFRDAIHMSHLGGSHFTHILAAALEQELVSRK
jgi:hypothetical protein